MLVHEFSGEKDHFLDFLSRSAPVFWVWPNGLRIGSIKGASAYQLLLVNTSAHIRIPNVMSQAINVQGSSYALPIAQTSLFCLSRLCLGNKGNVDIESKLNYDAVLRKCLRVQTVGLSSPSLVFILGSAYTSWLKWKESLCGSVDI